jgi:hypothetical protein
MSNYIRVPQEETRKIEKRKDLRKIQISLKLDSYSLDSYSLFTIHFTLSVSTTRSNEIHLLTIIYQQHLYNRYVFTYRVSKTVFFGNQVLSCLRETIAVSCHVTAAICIGTLRYIFLRDYSALFL